MVEIYLLIVEIVEAVTMVTELLLDILDRRHKKKSDRPDSRKDQANALDLRGRPSPVVPYMDIIAHHSLFGRRKRDSSFFKGVRSRKKTAIRTIRNGRK